MAYKMKGFSGFKSSPAKQILPMPIEFGPIIDVSGDNEFKITKEMMANQRKKDHKKKLDKKYNKKTKVFKGKGWS